MTRVAGHAGCCCGTACLAEHASLTQRTANLARARAGVDVGPLDRRVRRGVGDRTYRSVAPLPRAVAPREQRRLVGGGLVGPLAFRVAAGDQLEYSGFDLMAEMLADNQRLFSSSADRFGLASARFDALDMLTAPLPPAEVLLTKDTLIHFSNAHVMQFLRLSVIRCPPLFQRVLFVHDEAAANDDISTGQYRPLNLSAPPFALPTSTVFTWTANVRKVVEVLEPETLCTAAATRQSD